MSLPPPSPLLRDVLRAVVRRYGVPAAPRPQAGHPASSIAVALEQARAALAAGVAPPAGVRRAFVDALAQMIQEAMRADYGDPAMQALVLRHGAAPVREYASLSAGADQHVRQVLAAVNAVAHPAKRQRMPPGARREALAQLHDLAAAHSWSALAEAARRQRAAAEAAGETGPAGDLARLLDGPALAQLQRLQALETEPPVRQYQSLCDRQGPRPGSAAALAQGVAAQRRGAAVEALAAQALRTLAERLSLAAPAAGVYRVATSMRVPSSIPASAERAKSEWDAVLLREARSDGGAAAWDVCLLVEAKASVDAATTDLPRLLRGLRLLAHAEPDAVYDFKTDQGMLPVRGRSLRALPTEGPAVESAVLYCCDAPAEPAPRLLNAAGRMQLLSAPPSLEYAWRWAEGKAPDARDLEPVWQGVVGSPEWAPVLNQYATLRQVRALMAHTDDLLRAVQAAAPARP